MNTSQHIAILPISTRKRFDDLFQTEINSGAITLENAGTYFLAKTFNFNLYCQIKMKIPESFGI